MASIRRRKRAKRDVWCVDYRDGAGVRRRMTALTREIAEDLLAEKIRESRQAAPEVIDREITLAAYAARWLAQIETDIKPRTHVSYSETLDRYILPTLGRVKVRALHRGVIRDLLGRRRVQGLSKNTVRLIRGVLSVLLGDAFDDGIIATNPALQMGRRRRKRADSLSQAERLRRVRPMSSEQLAAFLKAALLQSTTGFTRSFSRSHVRAYARARPLASSGTTSTSSSGRSTSSEATRAGRWTRRRRARAAAST
jgi:integrase